MSVLSYRDFQKFLDNNSIKDMSYKDYIKREFTIDCLHPYKLYETKKFLIFKRKVFLKNIPCGTCNNCYKNRYLIKKSNSPKTIFELTRNLTALDLKEFLNGLF